MHAPTHELSLGETPGEFSDRTHALSVVFDGCGFDAPARPNIMQDMWDKFAQLAAGAGMTCMMRARRAGGLLALYAECRVVATAEGFPSTPIQNLARIHVATYEAARVREPALV